MQSPSYTTTSSPHAPATQSSSGRPEDLSSLLTQPPVLPPNADGAPAKILVLKVGTSTLMDANRNVFSLSNLGKFVDAVCDLKETGYHVVLISSGAVGSGCVAMHMKNRPKDIVQKQAVSAIGQSRLMRLWEDIFAIREKKVAQLLLTRRDLMDRPRFVNFRNTLLQLLSMDVVPIINENDALATDSLKFGDNDTLGAYVAVSINARWFFMLTDVDALYTANPRHHAEARPIAFVSKIDAIYQLLREEENTGTQWGSGGMKTKIIAAKLCCATGIHTGLCHGQYPERIVDLVNYAESITLMKDEKDLAGHAIHYMKAFEDTILKSPDARGDASALVVDTPTDASGEDRRGARPAYVTFPTLKEMPYLGTVFAGQPCTQSLKDQRRWILSLPVRGQLYCDENCVRAVIQKRKSLFAAGILVVSGNFFPGEAVALYPSSCLSDAEHEHTELARLIVNFSSREIECIKGRRSAEFRTILGYYCATEVANRGNIIFVDPTPVYEKWGLQMSPELMVESDDEDEEVISARTYSADRSGSFKEFPAPVEAFPTH